MHEVHLMKRIVRLVEDQLGEGSGARLVAIRLRVDGWSHLASQVGQDDAPIQWAFAQAARGTVAEGARLELTCPAPASGCPACGSAPNLQDPGFICPACGRVAGEASAELVLQELVVEEPEA